MPLFDPSAGMFGSQPGAGVLAPAVQPGVQSPLGPPAPQNVPLNWQDVLKKLGELWGAQGGQQSAAFRAATLRHDQPYTAKGGGPLGIRIGEGPGGWMVSIGDLVAGLRGRKMQEEADAKAQEAMQRMAGASGSYAQEKLRNPDFVPQGTPLGF